MNKLSKYIGYILLGLFSIGLAICIFFPGKNNKNLQFSKIKNYQVRLAPGERARLKDMEYTITGFKNHRLVSIKAKNAVAKDAKVMPFIRTSLKQVVHLRRVLLKSFLQDELEIEIEAKKARYDLQKKRINFSDLKKVKFFDKDLRAAKLSLILDTDLEDIKISTGPYTVLDASNRIIKRGRNFSGSINELFKNESLSSATKRL